MYEPSISILTVQMLPVTKDLPVGSYLPVFVGISEPDAPLMGGRYVVLLFSGCNGLY